ncbi:hypothetical protein DEU56DRAFT_872999 [Suillus clintonianus]|uniref:uncharacterized protein n=1 Tax=Suillus clintonianus TaxID=1904413 RepID=UPI001B876DE9|nr:uncharacterized protein DEU56DRAFT_872999 [Suillus clintonianus]KAG2125986.1 hypothetical protein DEU56DRAFT_872999 [Suillus clintonianus]
MPGSLQSLQETLGTEASPNAMQASPTKHLFEEHVVGEKYKEFLLSTYLLPILQDLKCTKHNTSQSTCARTAPTHEFIRQLASFAKSLSYVINLRDMCARKVNSPSLVEQLQKWKEFSRELALSSGSRPVDLLVGTPMKLLDMERGRGWNWKERIGKKAEEHEDVKEEDGGDKDSPREFWIDEPEMGSENVEWVVVNEGDVLFDLDFQEYTSMLLVDIAAARGLPVQVVPSSALSSTPDSEISAQPISCPFNFILTSATIPTFLTIFQTTTQDTSWTDGNKSTDIERRICRVWAEDALVHSKTATGPDPIKLSKLFVFCNKRHKVEQFAAFLDGRGFKTRKRGLNHHLDVSLKTRAGNVVVFGRAKGRAVGRTEEVNQRVRAVAG